MASILICDAKTRHDLKRFGNAQVTRSNCWADCSWGNFRSKPILHVLFQNRSPDSWTLAGANKPSTFAYFDCGSQLSFIWSLMSFTLLFFIITCASVILSRIVCIVHFYYKKEHQNKTLWCLVWICTKFPFSKMTAKQQKFPQIY